MIRTSRIELPTPRFVYNGDEKITIIALYHVMGEWRRYDNVVAESIYGDFYVAAKGEFIHGPLEDLQSAVDLHILSRNEV